ncbi:MAG: hypothetical protein NC548_36050 [Lachnospiraceae bacterium]|nr:hypothetical protein [Lachnospiraceae bacterium]
MANWVGGEKVGRYSINKEWVAVLYRGVKNGAEKIWEAISSCFGSGWWREEDSWSDEDSWVD